MQEQPLPAVGNVPCEDPLFGDADDNALRDLPRPKLPTNMHMAQNERTLQDYALPSLDMVQETIARLTITTNNFEIKPAMIQMIQNNLQFRGTMIEDPNQHLKHFLQLCDTFKYNEVTNDAIRLRLFSFSLINNAFSWLDSQAPGSIRTWDELAEKFLQKFFPISKAVQLRREIIVFRQMEGESFHEWPTERFTYGQKPATVKATQEDDKYQQIVDKLNRIESASTLIEKEMQSMRTDVKQMQSECTNSTRTLTKLEDQMSQLMSMMGDIKRQISTHIPSNTEDNPQREGKEHVKVIALRSVKLIEKGPKFSKFLKEMMTRRKEIKVGEHVNLNAFWNLKATQITLQLVNRSSVYPNGVLEDVLVNVRSFIIPVDFIVLDFKDDHEIPILLGRPFLATSRSTIDLEKNELTMKINGETETFKYGYQLNEENRRKLWEHCKNLSIFDVPKSREMLHFMDTERLNRFKERDKRARPEWHNGWWTNANRIKRLSTGELAILLDKSGNIT
ncbi:oligopeptide transporter 4-like [Gossypium australe]|uniref:Oligopeptide transporter 4-like n=1 Tax=Gossypium australe TaxID=47621 RepID=A0A5B6V1A2_9ROSI|nr:oligopeptide transporter 4-like [Gossypium australe]